MKEFNLSSKEVETDSSTAVKLHYAKVFLKEDVKEFIRLLKERFHHSLQFTMEIDKLAGEDLI